MPDNISCGVGFCKKLSWQETCASFVGQTKIDFDHLRQIASVISFIKKFRQEEPIGQALTLRLIANRGCIFENVVMDLHDYRQAVLLSREQPESSFFDFPKLLVSARFLGCSNPRDKIYAILGVVPSRALDMRPNYENSVEEVYGEALRYWIRDTGNLNFLSWVTDKARRRVLSFPSWVGEFDVMRFLGQQELGWMNVRHFATGSSTALPVDLKPANFRCLTVRGKNIDQIVELARPWAWHGTVICFDPCWTSMTLKLAPTYATGQARGEVLIRTMVAEEVGGQGMDSFADMDAFKAMVKRDTCFALTRQLHRLCWFSEDKLSRLGYEKEALVILQELDTLSSTDDSGFIPSLEEVRAMRRETCPCTFNLTNPATDASSQPTSGSDQDPPPSPNPACLYTADLQGLVGFDPDAPAPWPEFESVHSRKEWETDFSSAIFHVMFSRRMARTQNGYLGLVPDSSQIGDSIWLLQGASVPMVLRKAALNEQQAGDAEKLEKWELMGDSYVHGVMQGQVWNEIKENELVNIDLV